VEESSSRLIYRGTRHAVSRARRADGTPVVIKTLLGPGAPDPEAAASLEREYRLLRSLELPGIARALSLVEHAGRPDLVLADAGDQDLGQWLYQRPLPLARFYDLAIDLTETVARLHQLGVIHRDISPQNVVVYRDGRLTLVDFDAASPIENAQGLAPRGAPVGWALRYLAPEETGRTDRLVDSRADLYGLGATFYEMLTGTPPFSALDPVELLHAQLARPPVPPDRINPRVSAGLTAIVLRLLAKMPEARHTSAEALLRDLRRARSSGGADLTVATEVAPAAAGPEAAPEVWPETRPALYGRQQELDQLNAAWERVAAGGSQAVVLVGEAGIGKSTLARALVDQVARSGGRVIAARFPPRRSQGPYGPLLQTVRQVVRELGNNDEVTTFSGRLIAELGDDLWALTRVVPQLESLFEHRPAALPPEPAEAQRALGRAFVGFIRALGAHGRPLLLFLDDLQWADPESLQVLRGLLERQNPRVMLLGTRRPEPPEQPGSELGGRATIIPLAQLDCQAIVDMTAELLACEQERAAPLGELLWRKTGGNPLFCRKLMGSLRHSRLLRYDPDGNGWTWHLPQIAGLDVTDNVADLMVQNLRQLPESTREALGVVACLGHQAPLRTVARARQQSEAATREALEPAVRQGHIIPLWTEDASGQPLPSYQFAHDRVLEAAYSLLSAEQRPRLHRAVGLQLLEQARHPGPDGAAAPARSNDELGDELFAIVDQLNVGHDDDTDDDRGARRELAELNLGAARRARLCAAFGAELAYLQKGLELLPADAFRTDSQLALALHAEAMESAFVNRDPVLGQRLFDRARTEASSLLDRADIYQRRAASAGAHGDQHETGRLATEALEMLGVRLNSDQPEADLARALADNARCMGNRTIEELIDSPRMEDPLQLCCMQLLSRLQMSAFVTQPRLWPLVLSHMVNLSLRHGVAGPSAQAYVSYGVLLLRRTGDHRLADRFGRLGLALAVKLDDPVEECRAAAVFAAILAPWTQPLREMLPGLRRTLRLSVSCGDRVYGISVAVTLTLLLYHQGRPLPEVRSELEAALVLVQRANFFAEEQNLLALRRVIQRLAEGSTERTCIEPSQDEQARCRHLVTRLGAAYLLGELEEARELAAGAEAILPTLTRSPLQVELNFYSSLTLARWCDRQAGEAEERQRMLARIVTNQHQLGLWAETCPDNYRHKHQLVAAELCRLSGKPLEAAELYDQAMDAATRVEFHQDAALAAELAARFHRSQDRKRFARSYLALALEGYQRWGADAKRRALESELSDLRGGPPWVSPGFSLGAPAGGSGNVDLISLARASEVIAGEIVLDRLCGRLLEVCLALGGAERGALLLMDDGQLSLRATASVGSPPVVEPRPGGDGRHVPLTVLQTVRRTEEPLVVSDANQDPDINGDRGVIERGVRSMLALPIMQQGRLGGVLYLEHSAATRAFTPERVRLLQLLSTHIAIALENSRLFERLTTEIQERTRAEATLRFLSEAGVALGESLDYQATLDKVVQLAVPWLADRCVVDLLDAHGTMQRRAASEPNPASGDPVRAPGASSGISVPLLARGRVLGAMTFSSHRADRRYGPAELALAEELARRASMAIENARLYAEARQAVRLREEFLAVASHELNTPITSLRLLTAGLQEQLFPQAPPDLMRAVTIIERQSKRLSVLVHDLLDVAHLQAGRPPLHNEAGDLGTIVRQAVEAFQPPGRGQSRQSALEVRATVPLRGQWDRARIEQVVSNLLSNAVKFGSGKPVTITVEAMADDRARLVIEDQGIGIPPDRLPYVFDRFERAVPETHYGGLGLGLYIVREVVRALGGDVAAHSVEGEGSRFTVELPIRG
jgi:predicted ATPase/signal transduction histidine kinase